MLQNVKKMSYKFTILKEIKILKRTLVISLTKYYKHRYGYTNFKKEPIFLFRIGKYQYNFELKDNVL